MSDRLSIGHITIDSDGDDSSSNAAYPYEIDLDSDACPRNNQSMKNLDRRCLLSLASLSLEVLIHNIVLPGL